MIACLSCKRCNPYVYRVRTSIYSSWYCSKAIQESSATRLLYYSFRVFLNTDFHDECLDMCIYIRSCLSCRGVLGLMVKNSITTNIYILWVLTLQNSIKKDVAKRKLLILS